jgi:hypothetical protein
MLARNHIFVPSLDKLQNYLISYFLPLPEKQVALPVHHLPQGLFLVTVQGSETAKTAKLVITK